MINRIFYEIFQNVRTYVFILNGPTMFQVLWVEIDPQEGTIKRLYSENKGEIFRLSQGTLIQNKVATAILEARKQ